MPEEHKIPLNNKQKRQELNTFYQYNFINNKYSILSYLGYRLGF